MDKDKIIDLFRQIGLSENESRVYFAMLSIGPNIVSRIARTAGIKRTTVYPVIESLKDQGLVRIELSGSNQKFAAEDPAKLEAVVEASSRAFKDSIPALRSLFVSDESASSVKYYQGLKAIRSVANDLLDELKPKDFYFSIVDGTKWQALDSEFLIDHIEKRSKLSLTARVLMRNSEQARWRKQYERNFNEEVKILPPGTELDIDLVITPTKLVMFQLDEPLMAFVIENKASIKMQKQLFEIIWNSIGKNSGV